MSFGQEVLNYILWGLTKLWNIRVKSKYVVIMLIFMGM